MQTMQSRGLFCAIASVALVAACARIRLPEPPLMPTATKDYWRPLPDGAPALRKITDPTRIPNFRQGLTGDRTALLAALDQSIRYFGYPSSRNYFPVQDISHERASSSLIAVRELLSTVQSGDELQQRIVADYDVYESVGCDDQGTVLFTGYYTPIFDASLTPVGEYRWPLHGLPPDLVKDREGKCLGRRREDGSLVPYHTRGEIDDGALAGQELVYLKDRFEAYVCTVQGSARLRLQGGGWYNVGYSGNNGKEYTSVGSALLTEGKIAKGQLSLTGLMKFFKENPAIASEYLRRNERYVFFQKSDGNPRGSLGLPVTPYRSIATDKRLFPRGCLSFVTTQIPQLMPDGAPAMRPFTQFVLDQDTGGAIRAAGRCDIYIGIGERAGRVAGWTFNEGQLYYLFLKE